MVRHYISNQISSYFYHRMGSFHHGLVLFVLGIALMPIVIAAFALQLGIVVLAHEFVLYFWDSWNVFFVAGAVTLAFAGLVLARGVYELFSFVFHTWFTKFGFVNKVGMSITFIIDFLMSDVLMAIALTILSYSYVLVGLNQRFGSLWMILLSIAILWVGVFFQVSFVSAYTNAKKFGRVVEATKRFVVANPEVALLSGR